MSVRETGYAMGMSMKGHPIGYQGKLYTVVSARIDHGDNCGHLELEEVKDDGTPGGAEGGGA